MCQSLTERPIVVKIGGSTLGGNDTSLQDLVALHGVGRPIVIVHGGGNVISDWMQRQNLAPNFVNGLRVPDAPSLEIVVAVLGGLVNKELTGLMQQLGGPTIGISGMDGCLLQARVANPDLGYVGEIVAVEPAAVNAILSAGFIPMISPIAVDVTPGSDHGGQPLNVNGDTAAGALANAASTPAGRQPCAIPASPAAECCPSWPPAWTPWPTEPCPAPTSSTDASRAP